VTASAAALRTSIAEQLAALAPGFAPPEPLLDVAVRRTAPLVAGGERAFYVLPSDWRALREHERGAGRPAPYWAVAWPSGLSLARAVARRGAELAGRRVLELGCGVGLPSVAAARAGAEVLATDGVPEAVVFAAHTLALNGATGETALVEWREPAALVERGPWDVVLAADVLYTRQNVEVLPRLLRALLAPGGEAWLTDPGRSGAAELLPVVKRLFDVRSERDADDERVRHHTLRRLA
jgi:predicted nicotinamide N-methyase